MKESAPGKRPLTPSRRQIFIAGALAGVGTLGGCRDDGRLRLRLATDVNRSHLLTETLTTFAEALTAAFPERLKVEIFASGQMYYDRDMARALMRGDIDMAAPTITTLSRIVPECGITSLPAFYGRDAEATHRISDGNIGRELGRRLTGRLGVMPLYPYVDLGFVDLFTTDPKQVERADPKGLKIRVFSGAANIMRLRALGAYPVMLPFADVPMALAQGAVDALETTNETVRTGQLWDAGVTAALEQHASFVQYVPLIGRVFWEAADASIREGVIGIWRETCLASRAEAANRQLTARALGESNGIVFRGLEDAERSRMRARLEPVTDRIVSHIGMDRELVAWALRTIAGEGA